MLLSLPIFSLSLQYCSSYCVLFWCLQDELYRKAVMLETLLLSCDLDLTCMRRIVRAINDVLESLPQTITDAVLVHHQAWTHVVKLLLITGLLFILFLSVSY